MQTLPDFRWRARDLPDSPHRTHDEEKVRAGSHDLGLCTMRAEANLLRRMVGANGFEPSTSWSRTRRASQAALRPDVDRTRKEKALVTAERRIAHVRAQAN